jgi:capsid portal protein
MIYYADGDDRVEVSKIETDDANERFITIKDNARSNIYTAMRCTPNLMGLPTTTTGFNSQEYSSAFKLYQKSVIQGKQDRIVKAINSVIGKNAISIIPFQIIFEEN